MQAQACGSGTVKKVSTYGLAHVDPQLVPSVGLGDNAFAERLGDKAAVRLLCDFKNQFVHDVDCASFVPAGNCRLG